MTRRETDLYRWFETFTLSPEADAADPFLALALERRYVERKRTGELAVTEAGWHWFAVRSAVIIASCEAGAHQMLTKTPFCTALHCMWCGHCDDEPCLECYRIATGGTIEGGWKEPLEPTHDVNPRSTIGHGYSKE